MENWRIFLRIQWNKKQISGGLRISCVFERESPSNNSTAMGIKWYGQFEIMTIHRRIISWVMVLSLVHRTRTIQFLKRRRQEKATNIRNILHNTSIFTAKVPSNRVKYTTYRRKPLTKCIILSLGSDSMCFCVRVCWSDDLMRFSIQSGHKIIMDIVLA